MVTASQQGGAGKAAAVHVTNILCGSPKVLFPLPWNLPPSRLLPAGLIARTRRGCRQQSTCWGCNKATVESSSSSSL
eukprot:602303-Hanusia_phi.AAC.1